MASDAAGLEHVSVFLYKPESSIRSDWSDGSRSRGLQPASRKSIHGNRSGQYKHAQEAARPRPAATRRAKRSGGPEALPRRGARKEYFKPLKGQPMTSSLLESVDTSWSRVPNSESVATEVRQITSKFNPADPAASVPDLLKLRQAMSGIQDESWIPEKKADLDKIIAACLGLHLEASTATEAFTPGQTAAIKLEAINRSNVPVTLQEVRFPNARDSNKIDAALPSNELVMKDLSYRIPDDAPYSQPYWLRKPGTLGTFA